MVVYLDLAVADAHAGQIRGNGPARPNLQADAAWRNFHLGVAEPFNNPARPWFEVAFGVEGVVKVDPAKRILRGKQKAWTGVTVRRPAQLIDDSVEARPRMRIGAAGVTAPQLKGNLRRLPVSLLV
jgi:hypothetical protein